MRLFLDTSVLLGFFDNDERFRGAAQRLAAMEILGDAELWVYAQSYVEAHTLLSTICTDEAILPAFGASLELFSVCALDGEDIRNAVMAAEQNFDDCLVDMAAQKVKADVLLTRRETGYEDAKTLVMTPEELFEELESSGVSYE